MRQCRLRMRCELNSNSRRVLIHSLVIGARRLVHGCKERKYPMEIKWILDFLSLVDTKNFSRSADERATTQPAFSRRIKALEEWMGATLFDRSNQPIELTPAGRKFRPVAEEVLRRLLQSREEIQQRANTPRAQSLSQQRTAFRLSSSRAGFGRSKPKPESCEPGWNQSGSAIACNRCCGEKCISC